MPLIPIIFVGLLGLFTSIDNINMKKDCNQSIEFPLPAATPVVDTSIEIIIKHRTHGDAWDLYPTYKHGGKSE
jgi:hypothetical protein